VSTLENLPLFASDAEIGAALLGAKRASEWKALAPLYERQGFPKIDPVMGGRYVPAIKAFFDKQYGVATLVPAAPSFHIASLAPVFRFLEAFVAPDVRRPPIADFWPSPLLRPSRPAQGGHVLQCEGSQPSLAEGY
jgi:hypothetical protein